MYYSGGGGGSVDSLYAVILEVSYLKELYLVLKLDLHSFVPVLSALQGLQDQHIQVGGEVLQHLFPPGGQMPLDRYLYVIDCFFLIFQDKFMVASHNSFLQGYILTLVNWQILAISQ